MMQCSKCNTQVEKGKFCPECGAPLSQVNNYCPTCKCVVNEGKFCHECGTKLIPDPTSSNTNSENQSTTPYDQVALAVQYIQQGNYKAAVNILNEYACQNYSEAQFHLANCYYNGMGVKTNTKKATSYYKKAADQGHAQAAFYLGVIYQNSNDYQKSAQFYKRSYDLGFVDALAYYNQVSNMIDVNILPPVFSLKSFPGSDPLVHIAVDVKGKNIKHRNLILSVVFYYDNGDNLQGPLAAEYNTPIDCNLNGMLGSTSNLYSTVNDNTFNNIFMFPSQSLWPYPEYRGSILILAHMEICEIANNGEPIPHTSADYRFTLECRSGFLGFPKFKIL